MAEDIHHRRADVREHRRDGISRISKECQRREFCNGTNACRQTFRDQLRGSPNEVCRHTDRDEHSDTTDLMTSVKKGASDLARWTAIQVRMHNQPSEQQPQVASDDWPTKIPEARERVREDLHSLPLPERCARPNRQFFCMPPKHRGAPRICGIKAVRLCLRRVNPWTNASTYGGGGSSPTAAARGLSRMKPSSSCGARADRSSTVPNIPAWCESSLQQSLHQRLSRAWLGTKTSADQLRELIDTGAVASPEPMGNLRELHDIHHLWQRPPTAEETSVIAT